MKPPLLERFFNGDRLALARVISLLENGTDRAEPLLQALFPKTGQAQRIGFTGPPGAGKSTLIDRLVRLFRQKEKTVGVVAVDPTSPFTGGALLGDRLRMQSNWSDTGVFVRSMADRTNTGGLADTTPDVIAALDAFGKDIVVVETVGVGQSTLDIADVTETTVVVLTPESGDSIQAMKAGLMEIADILVVNKEDRAGANHFASDLQMVLEMRNDMGKWMPPVVRASAQDNTGVEQVYEQIILHQTFLTEHNILEQRRQRQNRSAIRRAMEARIEGRIQAIPDVENIMDQLAIRILNKEIEPYAAADEMLKKAGL